MELLKGRDVIKFLNLVVGKPELLKGARHVFEILNSPDVVTGEGKNFEILKALHGHDLNDGVSRQRELLTVLELVDFVIKLLDGVRKLADKADFGGLLRRDAVLLLPPADSFSKGNTGHIVVSFSFLLITNKNMIK